MLSCSVLIFFLSGCSDPVPTLTIGSGDPPTTTVSPPRASPPRVVSTGSLPTAPPSSACPGHRIGVYAWDQSYWRGGNDELLGFLSSSLAASWACGDVYINVGDYSTTVIPDWDKLTNFIVKYRKTTGRSDSVVWMTYGDVTARSGLAMIQFTNASFDWATAVSQTDSDRMGRIGISYDVEHLSPTDTETALLLCRSRREETPFGSSRLLISHTLDGDLNVGGTDVVMRLADSALAMVYSNFVDAPLRPDIPPTTSLPATLAWLVTTQCKKCLQQNNYRARITLMVEASCQMGKGCGQMSFCAADGGAEYMSGVLDDSVARLVKLGVLTPQQITQLFDLDAPFVAHNWEWFRCFPPFSDSVTYPNCEQYKSLAASCRTI
jgi:hypothetical protein